MDNPGEVPPYTWESCVVKIADKIAYLGRDLEDAIMLGIISNTTFHRELLTIFPKFNREHLRTKSREFNNTTLIHTFITDLCACSNPKKGIHLSEWTLELLIALRKASENLIYNSPRLKYGKQQVHLIINSIYDLLSTIYSKDMTITEIDQKLIHFPLLKGYFHGWLD